MRRSFVMAVVAAILGVALGGQAGQANAAPASSGEGKSVAPGGTVGETALPAEAQPLPPSAHGSPPGHLPAALALAPASATGRLAAPPFPPAATSPTCLGARATRGPPASRS
jgi:hypothetical protein